MDCRPLAPSDFDAALQVHPELFGCGVLTPKKARELWCALLNARGFAGVAVTDPALPGSLCGLGASVFVPEGFAERELQSPSPGVNGRLASQLLKRNHLAFSRSQVAMGNSNGGLNVVVLCGRWNPRLSREAEIDEACLRLAAAFAGLHVGYRLKRILTELISEQDHKFAKQTPVFRIHAHFPTARDLAIVEKTDVEKNRGTVLGPLFSCAFPVLYLGRAEQELLMAALDGHTDDELANRLCLSRAAIKKRWEIIFARVHNEIPELFQGSGKTNGQTKSWHTNRVRDGVNELAPIVRGPQKRHLVLAYVRKHPQELRPFARRPSL